MTYTIRYIVAKTGIKATSLDEALRMTQDQREQLKRIADRTGFDVTDVIVTQEGV